MLPSKLTVLESLPLHTNGKINRQELPAPDLDRPKLATRFSAPTNPMESVLVKIWSETLGINSVGIHDPFFDLGGDSMIAARIVSAMGRIFPWNLTLEEFYDACTVAQAAQLLVQKAPSAEKAEKVAALFLQVDGMSSDEIEIMLADERKKRRPEQPDTSPEDYSLESKR
jgi:acyl carrier protein